MVTFNWTISAAERAVSLNGLQDVIKTIHWRYRGTDENGTTAETYGAISLGDPNPEDFTSYDGITESDVIRWLESILGSELDNMKSNIENQIALLINPVMITGPLYSEPTEALV
jgi:hypothetical protein